MRHSIGLILAACTVLACRAPSSPRSDVTTTTASEPIRLTRAPAVATDASVVEGPPAPPSRCRVTVTDTEGCPSRDVEALVAPVATRLEKCRGTRGGKVRIHVREAAGKLAFDVEPGSSLDPTERQCVMDALVRLEADESSTAWAGLNVRPTGFTSHLTIEW